MTFPALARFGFAAIAVTTMLYAHGAHAMRLEGEAGLVSSKFTTNGAATLNSNTALTFGGNLEFDVAELLSFEPGLHYVPKGFNIPGYTQSGYYLSVPMSLKAKFPMPGLTPFVTIGPEISYELATYYSIIAGALLTKKLDYGLCFGGGLELSLLPGITNYLRVRYSLGLANIADTDASAGAESKTRALLITLGIAL